MKLTNLQMEDLLHEIEPILKYRNKIGYAVARNTRILSSELSEYLKFKSELVKKYGEEVPEEERSGPFKEYRVPINSPNIDTFLKELDQYASIEHDVDIMTCSYEDVIDILTGEEILLVDWMLKEDGDANG